MIKARLEKRHTSLNQQLVDRLCQSADLLYAFWPHRQIFPEVRIPVVCTFQDAIFFDFPEILGPQETILEYKRIKEWLERSSCVVVPSLAVRESLVRHFGERCANFPIIRHSITPRITSGKVQTVVPIEKPYVLYPATLTPHKNHANLLVAWSKFAKRSTFQLILTGPSTDSLNHKGPNWSGSNYTISLQGLIYRLTLNPREEYFGLGHLPDSMMTSLIANAKALVLPSLSEGGGSFPVAEALAAGVPVACSDIPVLREQITESDDRVVWFDPLCPCSIRDALEKLFDNYPYYKSKAEAMRSNATVSEREWDQVADKYVEIFHSVLQKVNPTPTARTEGSNLAHP